MTKATSSHIALLLLVLLLSACSTVVPEAVQQRYFFPPPPDEAKIEYLKGYFSDQDLAPEKKDFMTRFILGDTPPQALFSSPVDVASNGKGLVYVADSGLRQVIVLDLANHSHRLLAPPAGSEGLQRGFGTPFGVHVAADGRLYVSDLTTKTVDVFDARENYLFSLSEPDMGRPTSVAVDVPRGIVYVTDTSHHRLALFDLQGRFLAYRSERGIEPGQFNFPTDVDVDDQGNLYVLDSLNARVQVFAVDGSFLRMFGERGTAEGSFSVAKSLAVASTGQVYVTDALAHKVVIFSHGGEFLLRIGGKSVVRKGISPGGFYMPRGIDADPAGGIWVVDTLNRMVHNFQFLTPEYLAEHPLEE